MTPDERAEKIALDIHKIEYPGTIGVSWDKTGRAVIALIATQITEAVSDTERNMLITSIAQIAEARAEGRASMREEAARVCDKTYEERWSSEDAKTCANRIRAIP